MPQRLPVPIVCIVLVSWFHAHPKQGRSIKRTVLGVPGDEYRSRSDDFNRRCVAANGSLPPNGGGLPTAATPGTAALPWRGRSGWLVQPRLAWRLADSLKVMAWAL